MSRKSSRKQRRGRQAGPSGSLAAADLLQLFRDRPKPLTLPEILHALGLHRRARHELFPLLDGLVAEGRLIKTKHAWGLTDRMHLLTGRLEVQRSGVGYVLLDDKRRKDVFINPRDFGDAWHGDRVAVAITRERKNKGAEGRVARVIERGAARFTARVARSLGRGVLLCQPTDLRQRVSFALEPGEASPAVDDIVVLTPGERIDRDLFQAQLVAVLGREADVSVQEQLVKANHTIPTVFPNDALAEAAALPKVPSPDDFAGRLDLRHLPFVTIDGATARDFDDAIYVEAERGGWRLWVAIADVAHYVDPRSALDREAVARANSYYFPRSVEPMFPEALSNGLCSLNPHVPRLAMAAMLRFDRSGRLTAYEFANAVIQSQARLTYSQVKRALLDKDPGERTTIAAVLPMLETAEALARKLHANRRERGSLDFDLPEPEILFNLDGETTDIRPKVRHFGHQLIEEFMVAANEAVAEFLTERGLPLLYRIHPEPDPEKLKTLFAILAKTDLGIAPPEEITAKSLQAVLAAADGTEAEFMVGRLALRAMMQAKYSPDNDGHFGLASECYCHFTSPIRRYADLVVHRALKHALAVLAGQSGGSVLGGKRLRDLGDHLSGLERKAMEAEREILKRVTVLHLRDKVGQEFTGVVNGLADFGFWVELREVMAEGLVRLSTLNDDYYTFFPERQELLGSRTGRRFRLGQTVRVRLEEVNLGRLETNLTLLRETAPQAGARPAKGRSRPAGKKAVLHRHKVGGRPHGVGGKDQPVFQAETMAQPQDQTPLPQDIAAKGKKVQPGTPGKAPAARRQKGGSESPQSATKKTPQSNGGKRPGAKTQRVSPQGDVTDQGQAPGRRRRNDAGSSSAGEPTAVKSAPQSTGGKSAGAKTQRVSPQGDMTDQGQAPDRRRRNDAGSVSGGEPAAVKKAPQSTGGKRPGAKTQRVSPQEDMKDQGQAPGRRRRNDAGSSSAGEPAAAKEKGKLSRPRAETTPTTGSGQDKAQKARPRRQQGGSESSQAGRKVSGGKPAKAQAGSAAKGKTSGAGKAPARGHKGASESTQASTPRATRKGQGTGRKG